jgi:hypothetical protein
VVVLSNLAQFNPAQLSQQIIDVYLAEKTKTKPEKPGQPQQPKRKPIKLSKKKIKVFTGPYWLARSRLLRKIKQEGKKLFYVRSPENKSELIPYDKTSFYMKEFPQVTVEFSDIKEKQSQKMKVTVGKEVIDANRVELFKPSPELLKEYTGLYESDELEVRFNVVVDKKGIFVDFKKQDDDINYMQPLIKDRFSSAGGYATISFKRDEAGKITGFNVDTGRIRNLKFIIVK